MRRLAISAAVGVLFALWLPSLPAAPRGKEDLALAVSEQPLSIRLDALRRVIRRDDVARGALAAALRGPEAARLVPLFHSVSDPRGVDLLLQALDAKQEATRVLLIGALARHWGARAKIVPRLEARMAEAGEAEVRALLRAAIRLHGPASTGWLVREAMGSQARRLIPLFDPAFRQDVLLELTGKLPASSPLKSQLLRRTILSVLPSAA